MSEAATTHESLATVPSLTDGRDSARPLICFAAPVQSLPSSTLALIASHLSVQCILCLQRCSSTQRRLRANDAYMRVAWRWAKLRLSVCRNMFEWTVSQLQAVRWVKPMPGKQRFVFASAWQAALPRMLAAADGVQITEANDPYKFRRRFVDMLHRSQPTRWILAKRWENDVWTVVEDSSEEGSPGVQSVEVLNDVDWLDAKRDSGSCEFDDIEVRCGLVLQACPHLQHLDFDVGRHEQMYVDRHYDVFAMVPLLRSLHVYQSWYSHPGRIFDFQEIVDGLPQLTTLRCTDIRYLSISDLLAIASHSTLEVVTILCRHIRVDRRWLGLRLRFPASATWSDMERRSDVDYGSDSDSEQQDVDYGSDVNWITDAVSLREEDDNAEARAKTQVQRMRTALCRTQPTQRSCEVRLALADWLHARLRRRGVYINDETHTTARLHRYRRLLALLRSSLRQQLSELEELSAALSTSAI